MIKINNMSKKLLKIDDFIYKLKLKLFGNIILLNIGDDVQIENSILEDLNNEKGIIIDIDNKKCIVYVDFHKEMKLKSIFDNSNAYSTNNLSGRLDRNTGFVFSTKSIFNYDKRFSVNVLKKINK
jgi:hypothetical protein